MLNNESSPIAQRTVSSEDFSSIKQQRVMREYKDRRHKLLTAGLVGARSILGDRDGRAELIAEDAVHAVMEKVLQYPDRIPNDVENIASYMFTMVKNKAIDLTRDIDARRFGKPFGQLRELDTENFENAQVTGRAVGRYPGRRPATSPYEQTSEVEREEAQYLLRAFYDLVLREGEFGGSRFERPPGMTPDNFERMLHVLRYFVHGLPALEIARRLVDTGLMQPFDQQDNAARKRAEDLVSQIKHRAEERLRAMVDEWPRHQYDALHDAYRKADEDAS